MWALALRLKSACTAAPAGRVDGRAATACLCVERSRPSPVFVVARFSVSSREREGATPSFFFGRSLAPLVCKKRRVFKRTTTNMVVTTTTT